LLLGKTQGADNILQLAALADLSGFENLTGLATTMMKLILELCPQPEAQ